MAAPNDRLYTQTHEWIKIEGDSATLGITEFAVAAIKDVVFLELPKAGKAQEGGKPFGVIESVKAVFDLNAPLAGTVSEVNSPLMDQFEPLTQDPYGKGWMIKLKLSNPGDRAGLLDAAAYDKFCAEEHH